MSPEMRRAKLKALCEIEGYADIKYLLAAANEAYLRNK